MKYSCQYGVFYDSNLGTCYCLGPDIRVFDMPNTNMNSTLNPGQGGYQGPNQLIGVEAAKFYNDETYFQVAEIEVYTLN
jgi:hypothetical protein